MTTYRDYHLEMAAEIRKRLIGTSQLNEETTKVSIHSIIRIAAEFYYEACDELCHKNMGEISDTEQARERHYFNKLAVDTLKEYFDTSLFPDLFKVETINEILVLENNKIAHSNNNIKLIDASLDEE